MQPNAEDDAPQRGSDDEISQPSNAAASTDGVDLPPRGSWGSSEGDEGVLPSSPFGFDAPIDSEDEGPPRAKPLLARLLNRIGIRTGSGADTLLDWIQVLAVAALLAWLTMSYVVVRMRVPTGSMEPTIHTGSSFFVDKLSFYFRQPHPGDIIVFWHTEGNGNRVRYVKRLIATEGQTVQIKDCVKLPREECGIYVDGVKLTDPAFDRPYYTSGRMGEEAWVVEPNSYFVMGDNSRNSLDSRFWGFANKDDFIGEPFLRVWPLNQFGFMNGYFGTQK